MNLRPAAATLASAVVVAAFTACSASGDSGAEADLSSSPTSPPSSTSPASPTPGEPMDGVSDAPQDDNADNGEGHEDGHQDGTVVPGAGADAAGAAVLVLQTWARPRLSYEQWWAALAPLLSTSAQQDYAATDPSLIPPLQVLDETPEVVDESDVWARVAVATTEGRFEVEMTRSAVSAESDGGRGGGWQAARIYFPQS